MRPTFSVIRPDTGETVRKLEGQSTDEAIAIVEDAHAAYRSWRRTSFADRAKPMRNVAKLLRERKDDLAELMATEMGKPITDGVGEVEKCAWVCEYYADNAEAFLRSKSIETELEQSFVAYRPLGPVLAVMPWNFPLWQVYRFAAPALMAGNVGLLKHAPNVPGSSLAIQEIFSLAGFPPNVFRSLFIDVEQTSTVLEHPLIKAATLTGSTRAGRSVAEQAGRQIKKTVLELGGSDPYVILEDADIEESAALCAKSRLTNSGQSCIAAKRFIVHSDVYERWLEAFVEEMRAAKLGSPFDSDTRIGPQARLDLRDTLHDQIRASIDAGARAVLGGTKPDGPGSFYPSTVLVDVPFDAPAAKEELFGPAAAVFRVTSEEAAIELANSTVYGLGAAVFTRDVERGRRIATDALEAGACFVNTFVKSDPRLPFGGTKESGYGRELSVNGIREFVNTKTVGIG